MSRLAAAAAVTVGAAVGLVGAVVLIDRAAARLVEWSDRQSYRRALGGAR